MPLPEQREIKTRQKNHLFLFGWGTTTTDSSLLVHCKLYCVPACAAHLTRERRSAVKSAERGGAAGAFARREGLLGADMPCLAHDVQTLQTLQQRYSCNVNCNAALQLQRDLQRLVLFER